MATEPLILLNGTTADANQVMQLFDEIYSNIDETNVAAGNKTGSGKFVLQTSPTITTPTITGLKIGGAGAGVATVEYANSATNRTVTIPDSGAASSFVTTEGNQTINGVKTISSQLISTVVTGTSPFSVDSTTQVTNLNAQLLSGKNANDFAEVAGNETITGQWTLPAIDPPPANVLSRRGICKAWVQFSALGNITSSFNISAATRVGAGHYTFDFNTDMNALGRYCPIATADTVGGLNVFAQAFTAGQGQFGVLIKDLAGVLTDNAGYAIVFGDQ